MSLKEVLNGLGQVNAKIDAPVIQIKSAVAQMPLGSSLHSLSILANQQQASDPAGNYMRPHLKSDSVFGRHQRSIYPDSVSMTFLKINAY